MAAATTKAPKVRTSDFDDAPARDARLFLIDGSSLAYRSFFALPQEIATSDGRPTNALLGFANMLLKLVADYRPETVIVAWDVGGVTKRKEAFPEYKSQRPQMPDLLSQQWPHFRPLVEGFGFTNISLPAYEADDVIGTLARESAGKGIKTCIVTYDRDAMQLVDDRTVVMMTTKGVSEVAVFTPERVQLRYGVRPDQIADFIALRGDTSDNIPGVAGIGDKTAADLLTTFGSLERLLEGVSKVSGTKRRESIEAHAEQLRMNKELATIVCDLPLDMDLDAVHAEPPDRSKLGDMFRTFEFRTLARRVSELEIDGSGTDSLEPTAAAPPTDESAGELVSARLVSPHELRGVLAAAPQEQLPLVVRPLEDGTVLAACRVEEGVPDGGQPVAWVAAMHADARTVAEAIRGHAVVTFDYKGLPAPFLDGGDGNRAVTLADDLMLSSYLLEPGRRTFLLGEILAEMGLRVRLAFSSEEEGLREVTAQAAVIAAARDRQRAQLEAAGTLPLYCDIELPLVDVLVDVERVGIRIDTYRMGEIAHKVADQLDELRDRAYELAGDEFNLGSPPQLAKVLFEQLGLPTSRKGKTGYSTDARVLRDLRDMHPIVPVIESWRELSKLKSTYLDSLPGLVNQHSGRIHTTFSQVTAATGRLSSVSPNLQNIPVRTALGREIRSAFVPEEGWLFVSCDYSQVELRLLAHVSQEPKLIETFERGEDVHLITAAEVAGVEPSQVTRDQRNAAKAINFGIIYGISSFGLAQQLQISREQAQEYIDRYLGRYPHVGDFMERTIEAAKADGYVTTLFGRRRPIPELKSRSFATRGLGERLAINTILQGTAADVIKIAMVRTQRELREGEMQSRIVLQIHDELLLEAPKDEVREVTQLVREAMAEAFEMKPPLVVDAGTGTTWLDAK